MNVAQSSPLLRAPLESMPREYNFAADILKRNLDAGRAGKLAFIDHRQGFYKKLQDPFSLFFAQGNRRRG